MKLRFNGHACFTLTLDNGFTFVTDPFDASVGYARPADHADVVTISHAHHDHNDPSSLTGPKRILDTEGVWTLGGARVEAIPSFHDDAHGAKRGTNLLFKFQFGSETVVHLGDLGHMPDARQIAFLSGASLMLIPIGGFYTIDTEQALAIIREAKPKAVVPMHYKTPVIDFPIADETEFVNATGARRAHSRELTLPARDFATILDYC